MMRPRRVSNTVSALPSWSAYRRRDTQIPYNIIFENSSGILAVETVDADEFNSMVKKFIDEIPLFAGDVIRIVEDNGDE